MKKNNSREESKVVEPDDIIMISKAEYLASKKQPGPQMEIDDIRRLQRESSLDKFGSDKSLDSNKKEHSEGKPQSFNSDEFHSAHSKRSEEKKYECGDEILGKDKDEKDVIKFPEPAEKSKMNAEALEFKGQMTFTQSQKPHPNSP